MKTIVFITGNQNKFQTAQKSLEGAEITLVQEEIETPEIQSTEVEEVASYSAKWVAEKLKQPVVVTDAGYYIEALNGFPGPFGKFINKWLSSADLLNLMQGKSNRTILAKDCLAYCEPGEEPITFLGVATGTVAERPGAKGESAMDEVFVPEGFDKPQSEIPREKMVEYWSKNLQIWQKLAKHLRNHEK